MELSGNALKVLNERYFLKDKNGKVIEDWEKLCRRVAKHIASAEKNPEEWEDRFFEIMYHRRFLPNSPTLMNAGKENGMLSACHVLPINDSMESILETLKDAAMVHKFGGGTGFNFSNLRPLNSTVGSTTGTASGPVSFMRMYNGVTEEIKQGGTRRGANLGLLSVHHPDILDFIDCKKDTSKITNFNISVACTDKFMKAVENGTKYDLIDPRDNKKSGSLDAKEVFTKIVRSAWETGEPGLFFIDTVNKANEYKDKIINGVNPCGESPLHDYESCNLGSINVCSYYDDNYDLYDLEKLQYDITTSVRFLDNVITVNKHPLEKIKIATEETRKVGLGIMGFADLLIKRKIPYGSDLSIGVAKELMSFIQSKSIEYSEKIGEEKGICEACQKIGLKRRNLWTTIIAPTGSLSMIADCSSGCEPLFSVGFVKTVMDGKKLDYFHPEFERMVDVTPELKEKIFNSSSIQNIKGIPKNIRDIFVTANDVSMEDHVRMQAALQKFVHGGISKTINASNSAKEKDIADAFILAYQLGCKGITVYRDGCRPNQVLSVKKEEQKRKVFNRTMKMNGETEKIKTPLGNLFLTINKNSNQELAEVFLNIGKSGGDVTAFSEGLGKVISIALQYGVPPDKIAKQLKGIKGDGQIIHDNKKYTSIPDIIGNRLSGKSEKEQTLLECPICGEKLYRAENCNSCQSCGYSKC